MRWSFLAIFFKRNLGIALNNDVLVYKNDIDIKVLFIDGFTSQNFRLSLLRLVDRLYTVIHKT